MAGLDRVGEFIDNSSQNANLPITERGQFRDAPGSAIARLAHTNTVHYGCKVISNHGVFGYYRNLIFALDFV